MARKAAALFPLCSGTAFFKGGKCEYISQSRNEHKSPREEEEDQIPDSAAGRDVLLRLFCLFCHSLLIHWHNSCCSACSSVTEKPKV